MPGHSLFKEEGYLPPWCYPWFCGSLIQKPRARLATKGYQGEKPDMSALVAYGLKVVNSAKVSQVRLRLLDCLYGFVARDNGKPRTESLRTQVRKEPRKTRGICPAITADRKVVT
jgi:hypothetical protein